MLGRRRHWYSDLASNHVHYASTTTFACLLETLELLAYKKVWRAIRALELHDMVSKDEIMQFHNIQSPSFIMHGPGMASSPIT
jgi:hypothetical protein